MSEEIRHTDFQPVIELMQKVQNKIYRQINAE